MEAFLVSIASVAVAEMGDRTQLLALVAQRIHVACPDIVRNFRNEAEIKIERSCVSVGAKDCEYLLYLVSVRAILPASSKPA